MGFQRNIRHINMSPATGKEKRGRRSRSKAAVLASELPKFPKSRSKTGRKQTKASDVDSDTREGASQSTPITLDSDDSEPILELPKEHRRNAAMRKKALTSIHPAYEGSGLMYENRPLSSGEDDKPTKMQAAKGSRSFSRPKSDMFNSRHYPLENARPTVPACLVSSPVASGVSRPQPVDKVPKEEGTDGSDMALLDIDDFNTRSAVAQLMVVAPALLIRDLYHLIINNKGRFSEAKERAIRMNMDTCRENKPPLHPQQLHEHESDDDDILIKVDYNDPAFDWDTDEPEPEPIATTRSRLSKLGPKRKTTTSTNQHHASKKKKLIKSGKTSSDYGFVVEDNVMHYDFTADDNTESSGVDSQMSKHSDVEMSDGNDEFDLDIDMQPPYAYNAHLLGKGRSPTKR